MWNMERIGLTASEKMSFENFDGRTTDGQTTNGRTPDACIYYKLTYEPGELKNPLGTLLHIIRLALSVSNSDPRGRF